MHGPAQKEAEGRGVDTLGGPENFKEKGRDG